MSLNRVIKRLKIEMSGSTKQYQVSAKQSDRATRYVEIQLLDQGAEYEIPPGSNVTAYIKKPDLKRAYSPCTFSGSVVTMSSRPARSKSRSNRASRTKTPSYPGTKCHCSTRP